MLAAEAVHIMETFRITALAGRAVDRRSASGRRAQRARPAARGSDVSVEAQLLRACPSHPTAGARRGWRADGWPAAHLRQRRGRQGVSRARRVRHRRIATRRRRGRDHFRTRFGRGYASRARARHRATCARASATRARRSTRCAANSASPATNCACVGDDTPDIPMFERAGIAVAVADAHPAARGRADWVTQARGGRGAVREICDLLLAARAY